MNTKNEELKNLSNKELKETTGGFLWVAFAVGVLYGILSASWAD